MPMSHYAQRITRFEVAQEVLRRLISLYAECIHNESHRVCPDHFQLALWMLERAELDALYLSICADQEQAVSQVLELYSPRLKAMLQVRQDGFKPTAAQSPIVVHYPPVVLNCPKPTILDVPVHA